MSRSSLFITSAGIVVFSFVLYFFTIFIPLSLDKPVEVHIRKGMSFSDVATLLRQAGVIRDRFLFRLLAKLKGVERSIKEGYYLFRGDISPYNVLNTLVEGRVEEITVTIPEGFNLWQIARRLEQAGLMEEEEFLALAFDRKFLSSLQVDTPSLEGYIYPDTYRLPKGISPGEAITIMVKNMRRHFNSRLRERAEALGFTESEVLTLASIIEKEAKVDEERALISAVFHNRLKKGIPLQADPTTIYDLKGARTIVTKADTERASPYNTYLIKGLPPGPIASPGIKSIQAALYPAEVPYLYFVSMGNGRHYFSTTKKEHLRAVKRYRKIRNIEKDDAQIQ